MSNACQRNPFAQPHRHLIAVLLLLLCLTLTACSSYNLAGSVIEGPQSAVLVVSKNDPRLKQHGIDGASLMFTIDPESLNATILPMDLTDGQGQFSTPVNVTGAGLLEYQLNVLARAPGYDSASRTLALPGGNKRLLIILASGQDKYKPNQDILNETIDMGKQLLPRQ